MDSWGPVQPKVGPVVDFDFVETCLNEINSAVRAGSDAGCRHALQVLRALKHYLNQRASTGIAGIAGIAGINPAERLLLRQMVARARAGLRIEDEDGNGDLLRALLIDLEQMSVCDIRDDDAVDDAVDDDPVGDVVSDDMCASNEAAADGPAAMVAEASSATVVCAACGSVVLERRMEAHVRWWCSPL